MRSARLIGGGNELGAEFLSGGGSLTPDVCAESDEGLSPTRPAAAAIPTKARLPVCIATHRCHCATKHSMPARRREATSGGYTTMEEGSTNHKEHIEHKGSESRETDEMGP